MLSGLIDNASVRSIDSMVELYNGSTMIVVFFDNTRTKSISIERVGEENKFFGFGICQKLNIKLLDLERQLEPTTENSLTVRFRRSKTSGYKSPYPIFYITETNRDENTNELSITAYDALYKMSEKYVSDLTFAATANEGAGTVAYSMRTFAENCASLMGLSLDLRGFSDVSIWDYVFESGANFDGTETIREALNDIAEATQSIYFLNDTQLVFRRLDKDGAPEFTIDKSRYVKLDSQTNRRLSKIVSATELGDDVGAELEQSGTTQYIRDNAFYAVLDDLGTWIDNALTAVGGFTINQFDCSWRGEYLLEIGDKIGLITKDDELVYSYLLDDRIEFNGALSESTKWKYTNTDAETASNPTSLGEALKYTYAKVDKINREINLVASETQNNTNSISAIQINTNNINASVQKIEKITNDSIGNLTEELAELTNKVDATISEDELKIIIQEILEDGVSKVETNTGFTFNDEGLTVSKSDSEMSTLISEDGMKVYRDNEEMLIANNQGVKAVNLHATTYLIIGTNSRFEDYTNENNEPRTGCFWIGD